MTSNEVN
jgi:LAO/AO transport system kinase